MTPQERAEAAFDYFRDHGWIEDMHSKSVCVGMELAIAAAITGAVTAEREACAKLAEDIAAGLKRTPMCNAAPASDGATEVASAICARGDSSGAQEDKP